MFSSGPNYNKLKTNLRLSCNRLKLLEKKKTEINQKARKEIADFLSINKPDRARIRVESIIREDYLVEAMEILEMFCDLILARFGLVTQLKELDEGISEAVSSIIWVAPRLQADVAELKVVSDMLTSKYGKPYADASRAAVHPANVSDKLQHKMSIQAPPKLLVEKYLIEIAKIYNIDYEPDQSIMQSDPSQINKPDGFLIDFNNDRNNLDGNIPAPPGPGFAAYPQPPPLPVMPQPPANIPFNYPPQAPFNYPGPGNNNFSGPGNSSYPGPGNNSFSGPGNNSFSGPGNNSYPGPGNNSFSGSGNNIYPGPSNNSNNGGGGMSGYPNLVPSAPFNYNYNIPPNSSTEKKDLNVNFLGEEKKNDSMPPPYSSISPDDNIQFSNKPKPQPRSKMPDLPNVPSNLPDVPCDDDNVKKNDDSEIDFDDLSRRFEELKKRH